MRYRTVCVLMASFIMLLAAAVCGAVRNEGEEEARQVQAAAEENEAPVLPAAGKIIEAFGPQYSEELGQWSLNEEAVIEIEGRQQVIAPLDGLVTEIEAQAGGGSCVTMQCGETTVSLSPVYGLNVFEGSMLKRGDGIGSAREELRVHALRDGAAVDLWGGEE